MLQNALIQKTFRWLLRSLILTINLAHAQWFEHSASSMTTRVELYFWSDDSTQAERLTEQVFRAIDKVAVDMSRYRDDSELSAVNRGAAEQPIALSKELFFVLKQAQHVSDLSSGAFDITFASAGYLYDFRNAVQPSVALLNPQLKNINYRFVVLDDKTQTVRFERPGIMVDLGGIAKGYAVDRGMEVLIAAGIRHARLSAGGDMRLLGDKRGRPWLVGIKDPRSENQQAVTLPLADVAISTSGDYERFFIDDQGERIHHILSPKTGRPAQGIQSVTVIGNDATTTDGLSTAVFVLGVERGLELVNKLPGIDAIIIDSQRKMHFSKGLMESR